MNNEPRRENHNTQDRDEIRKIDNDPARNAQQGRSFPEAKSPHDISGLRHEQQLSNRRRYQQDLGYQPSAAYGAITAALFLAERMKDE